MTSSSRWIPRLRLETVFDDRWSRRLEKQDDDTVACMGIYDCVFFEAVLRTSFGVWTVDTTPWVGHFLISYPIAAQIKCSRHCQYCIFSLFLNMLRMLFKYYHCVVENEKSAVCVLNDSCLGEPHAWLMGSNMYTCLQTSTKSGHAGSEADCRSALNVAQPLRTRKTSDLDAIYCQ
jgi:hypothetical protein